MAKNHKEKRLTFWWGFKIQIFFLFSFKHHSLCNYILNAQPLWFSKRGKLLRFGKACCVPLFVLPGTDNDCSYVNGNHRLDPCVMSGLAWLHVFGTHYVTLHLDPDQIHTPTCNSSGIPVVMRQVKNNIADTIPRLEPNVPPNCSWTQTTQDMKGNKNSDVQLIIQNSWRRFVWSFPRSSDLFPVCEWHKCFILLFFPRMIHGADVPCHFLSGPREKTKNEKRRSQGLRQ